MKIDSLYRYPIKGLSPESLPSADVETGHGFSLDRLYAVTDGSFVFCEANPVPMPKTHFLMLARFERLALLKTKFNPDTHDLEVGTFDCLYNFALAGADGRKALAVFLTQFLATPLRGEAEVVQAEGHQFTDISVHSLSLMRSISLINLATLRDLGDHVGRHLDPRRFRANIYFDGAAPWSELDWVGKTLESGSVLLRIVRRTRRCSATSVDLELGVRDLNVPRSILDYRGHGDCGIYAEIVRPGRLQSGDRLSLLDDQEEMSHVFVPCETAPSSQLEGDMSVNRLSKYVLATALFAGTAQAAPVPSTNATTTYHRVQVDGVEVFYREAGPENAPTIVLLHGFPSSSREFNTLIPLLATKYHLIAPDYPGFGLSDAPSPAVYTYTFDHLAKTIGGLLEKLKITNYTLYLNDYGAPIGFRIIMAHPNQLDALIIQNGNIYDAGLGAKWTRIAEYWADPKAHPKVLDAFLSFESTKERHVAGTSHPDRYDPDTWMSEYADLSRPGQREIQGDLLYDYRTNVASYPKWQAWLRAHQPPTLVVWGEHDPSFIAPGAEAFRRDLPNAEIHLLDAGHFALDEKTDEIAELILQFMAKRPG